METILCPIDFSKCSLNALLYAYDIALQSGKELYLLHTYHIPVIVPLMEKQLYPESAMNARYEREAGEKIENLLAWLNKIHAPAMVNTTYRIASNFTVDEIVKTAVEEDIHLIVIGTADTQELKDIFQKTPMVRVIEETHCPVLAIPAKATYKKISHILYTTQANTAPADEVKFITDFAALFEAKVSMLHTSTEVQVLANAYAQQARQAMLEQSINNSPEVMEYACSGFDIQGAIQTITHQTPTDLLIISAHRKNLLEQMLSKHSSQQSSYSVNIPVLLMR